MRIGSMILVAVLAFGVGLALRGWSGDESDAVPPKAATSLDGDRTLRAIKLVRADPGALHRPARDRRPAPAAPGPSLATPPPPAPAALPPSAPAQEPSATPDSERFDLPDQPAPGAESFDPEE